MASVITEKCLGERYAACAAVCPVECIYPGEYQGKPFAVVDPDVCIVCGACISECPVGAIVESQEYDPVWAKINAELAPEWKSHPKVSPRPKEEPPRDPAKKRVQ